MEQIIGVIAYYLVVMGVVGIILRVLYIFEFGRDEDYDA